MLRRIVANTTDAPAPPQNERFPFVAQLLHLTAQTWRQSFHLARLTLNLDRSPRARGAGLLLLSSSSLRLIHWLRWLICLHDA
ncbi:hypothetical protein Hypma_000471 [Hypsizygus marmoreus]|uniref:Uncharacterized protein n=1 Tax=Hypsizygus marmoreus TaxID=39966 RepID=A0A369JCB9_HYPMA|nr:hypothetical protein Hypma_000471 [Hypsizygus marmoreus]